MAFCILCDRCFFFNEPLIDNLTSDAEELRERYCGGDFADCAIYRFAQSRCIEKVPGHVHPGDIIEIQRFSLSEACKPQEGLDMFLNVIYPNGTAVMVKASLVNQLVQSNKIVAYQCAAGWVELRRKHNLGYKGVDRRISPSMTL